jgi:hypothetical protein
MSADGRTFPDVGRQLLLELGHQHRATARRLLGTRSLSLQLVHPDDSVLGPLSRSPFRGLKVTYQDLVRQAFHPRWWDSPRFIEVAAAGTTRVVSQPDSDPATKEFTLMEYNFSLFFGLAVQAYEATLVADDTPFDRFLAGGPPLSDAAVRGLRVFFNLDPAPAPRGNCAICHSGSLLSEASVQNVEAAGVVRVAGGQRSDRGTRNIGVRETTDDLGNGGSDPFGAALSVAVRDALPGAVVAADGTFKIPGLRNVALTAPYFHNGGEATLLDVVDFYARGGNQGGPTNPILTRDGTVIGGLAVLNFNTAPDSEAVKADLVAFLESLTDERVRIAAAPFDHPQIYVSEWTSRRRDLRPPGQRTGHRLVPRDPGHRPERGSGPTGLPRGRLRRRAQPADAGGLPGLASSRRRRPHSNAWPSAPPAQAPAGEAGPGEVITRMWSAPLPEPGGTGNPLVAGGTMPDARTATRILNALVREGSASNRPQCD